MAAMSDGADQPPAPTMTERYFLDPFGAKTTRILGRTGGGHLEIGKEVLTEKGIAPADSSDAYTQMFNLKYVRIVEHEDGLVEVGHTRKLSTGQKQFLRSLEHRGKTLRYVTRRR
jgi:hypothetical protein